MKNKINPKLKPRKAWAIVDNKGNILTFANGPDAMWDESTAIALIKDPMLDYVKHDCHVVRVLITEAK